MSLFILTGQNSVANDYLAELRDKSIQQDSMRFRKNMKRIGSILAYEISRNLNYKKKPVNTILGEIRASVIRTQPYLITILRAGLPFYEGFIDYFDRADSGFIGSFRTQYDENMHFDIKMGYKAIGDISDREVIIIDPMLATGRSVLKVLDYLAETGKPKMIHIASLIAAEPGYKFLNKSINQPVQFWFGDMDPELNEKSYIVPGLGDAGDLCYGEKK